MKILTKEQLDDFLAPPQFGDEMALVFDSHEDLRGLLRRLWAVVLEMDNEKWWAEYHPKLYQEVRQACAGEGDVS